MNVLELCLVSVSMYAVQCSEQIEGVQAGGQQRGTC